MTSSEHYSFMPIFHLTFGWKHFTPPLTYIISYPQNVLTSTHLPLPFTFATSIMNIYACSGMPVTKTRLLANPINLIPCRSDVFFLDILPIFEVIGALTPLPGRCTYLALSPLMSTRFLKSFPNHEIHISYLTTPFPLISTSLDPPHDHRLPPHTLLHTPVGPDHQHYLHLRPMSLPSHSPHHPLLPHLTAHPLPTYLTPIQ